MSRYCFSRSSIVLACALASAGTASAAPITFTTSVGGRAALATFETAGNDLVVTLTNTSAADVLVPAHVLTALFFEVSGAPLGLAPVSAVVPSGSTVWFGVTDPGGVIGGEWAYREGLTGTPGGLSYGISSTGLDLFGPADRFPGSNLQGPISVGGLEYGITSAGDDPTTGNAPVTGANALVHHSVVFTLAGLPAGFDPATRISGVSWQYGTSLSEPHIPEPGTLAGVGLAGLIGLRRRR